MMSRHNNILILFFIALFFSISNGINSMGQEWRRLARKAERIKKERREKRANGDLGTGNDCKDSSSKYFSFLPYEVIGKDTIYFDVISASYVCASESAVDKKDWKKHYRLVYNFNKVYPYALLAARLTKEVDSTISANNYRGLKKERYIAKMQRDLMKAFSSHLKSMTISQGALLIKLVDREIGKSSYDIIKLYKNIFAAAFWQGIAKIFSNDLKTAYDPDDKDADLEILVKKWHENKFEELYYNIFFTYPTPTDIPSKYR